MTFDDVINDIEKMVGLELESIKSGANITLIEVDRIGKRVKLITSSGKSKTRPFSELKKIWDMLCNSPAAHVDSVLSGSGSSRNQPETVMANLPYIEWFLIDKRKHLALMKEPTHDYGTLLKMDEIKAIEIIDKLMDMDNTACEVVVITEDIRSTADTYEKINGVPLKSLSQGIYEQYKDKVRFIFVSKSNLNEQVEAGTYIVVAGTSIAGIGRPVTIDGKEYDLILQGGLSLLIPV
ncbi:hypothetical protein EJP82_19475 [Paenibacillus anaericanus]|uniref:Uncharacterized protein n=1 Tax=Paenibacillus anaericanus TaxID=170367 RepID=A0A3S1EE76_9BACL|nr:hypothetical protein [Paenibacillus anaericanus]RUT43723.1 hypothetical protein EJP82_19475 [Paenibacillus anaericanus]